MKKHITKIGYRGTFKELKICKICKRPIPPNYCQCPIEPTKELTDKWIDDNICSQEPTQKRKSDEYNK